MNTQSIDIPDVLSIFLRNYIEDKKITQTSLAQILRYSEPHMSRLFSGKVAVGYKTILRISKTLRRPELMEICGFKQNPNERLTSLPICGIIQIDELSPIKRFRSPKMIEIPTSWLKRPPEKYALYQITGTLLTSYGIHDQDLILVDSDPTELIQGSLCAIEQENIGMVKMLWADSNKYIAFGLSLPHQEHAPLIFIPKSGKAKIMPVIAQFRWHQDIPFES